MLVLTRTLAAIRRAEPALHAGNYRSVDGGSPAVFTFVRGAGADRVLVALNFGDTTARLDLSALPATGEILVATGLDRSGPVDLAGLEVRGHEGIVVRLPAEDPSSAVS